MELKLENVNKKFSNVTVIDNISCTLEKGVYGLLGKNGAGKTTLMRMLCTLLLPSEGIITWNGEDIFKLAESYRDKLGYLPQNYGYYQDLSIWDYMMYIASIKGIRSNIAQKRTSQLLEQVGLWDCRKRKMKNLSGGMVRRVGIAQAMLNDPKVLILDEPTVGLDPSERIRFRNLISELSQDRIVLLSTHIVSDVEFIANKIIFMKEGSFFFQGTLEDIMASMNNKVWRCIVSKEEVSEFLESYMVGNVKTVQQGVELRILSEGKPLEDAVLETATLEDAFLYYFGEKAGE